jgi:hypothetical protein
MINLQQANNVPKIQTPQSEKKLFAITRTDMPWSTRVVQISHAISMLIFKNHLEMETDWDNESGANFIFYRTANEQELKKWLEILGDSAQGFYEPDFPGCPLTAIAYWGEYHTEFATLGLL